MDAPGLIIVGLIIFLIIGDGLLMKVRCFESWEVRETFDWIFRNLIGLIRLVVLILKLLKDVLEFEDCYSLFLFDDDDNDWKISKNEP